ncbi:MAG: fatty acid desaturase family protein [Bdellovibrionota bacterium]
MRLSEKSDSISLAEYKKLLQEYFQPNPWIYWSDLICTAIVGYGSFIAAEFFPAFSAAYLLFSLISVFALYRGMLFIHELTHRERSDLPGFSIAWNLIFGVPSLFPSFMYRGVHIDHHKKNSYSTDEDGEYLPLGASPFWKTLAYLAQSVYLPFLIVLRFGLLTPVSFLHPKLRTLVMTRTSALAIRTDVARKVPSGIDLRNWYILEAICFVYVWGMVALFATGTLAISTLGHMYCLMVIMFFVNSIRTIVAHRYLNRGAAELNFQDQVLDSVNIEGNAIIAELVAPVGLRYHGLHHLFATIPYHNLGHAHRRLLAHLPKDSFYHQTIEPSLLHALATHWRNTKKHSSNELKADMNPTRAS